MNRTRFRSPEHLRHRAPTIWPSAIRYGHCVAAVCGAFHNGQRSARLVLSGDPIAFGGATTMVIAIALAASFFPAWKASRTDPLTALRRN